MVSSGCKVCVVVCSMKRELCMLNGCGRFGWRVVGAGLVALALVGLGACEKKEGGGAAKPVVGAFEVLSTGGGAKQVMKYGGKVGERFAVTIEDHVRMTQLVDGQIVPERRVPMVEFVVGVEVREVRADELMVLAMEVQKAGISTSSMAGREAEDAAREKLRTLEGLKLEMELTAAGVVKSLVMKGVEGLDEGAREMAGVVENGVRGMVVQLPGEAVGAGAAWKVTRALKVEGVEVVETSEYTLRGTGILGSVLESKSKVWPMEREVERQGGGGVKMLLSTKSGGGEGKVVVESGKPLASASSLSLKFERKAVSKLSHRDMVGEQTLTYTFGGVCRVERKGTGGGGEKK